MEPGYRHAIANTAISGAADKDEGLVLAIGGVARTELALRTVGRSGRQTQCVVVQHGRAGQCEIWHIKKDREHLLVAIIVQRVRIERADIVPCRDLNHNAFAEPNGAALAELPSAANCVGNAHVWQGCAAIAASGGIRIDENVCGTS